MFFVHTTTEQFKNTTIGNQFGFVFDENSVKLGFFRPHETEKPAFSNSSGALKSVFEKLRFRDGILWTICLTVEIKLRF